MINIVLDLDNTLLSALDKEEEKEFKRAHPGRYERVMKSLTHTRMDDSYVIFERPYLQRFLTFLFRNFNVSVWTAASKLYALYIIDTMILPAAAYGSRKLDYIFFSYHCRISSKVASTYQLSKPCHKILNILQDKFGIEKYTLDNTLIIDDHPDIALSQPSNCIHIPPFDVRDKSAVNDTVMLDLIRLLRDRSAQIKA